MLLPEDPIEHFPLPGEDEEEDVYFTPLSLPVVGLGDIGEGITPWPFPVNVYQLSGDDTSGLTGTLYPDGTYLPLAIAPAPQPTRWWEDSCACFRDGVVSWNGNVAGSIWIDIDGEEPHQRLWDASLTGDWPENPPRADRPVSVEGARAAAAERAREAREGY